MVNKIISVLMLLFVFSNTYANAKDIVTQVLQNQDYGSIVATPRQPNYVICNSNECNNNRAKFILPTLPAVVVNNSEKLATQSIESEKNVNNNNSESIVPKKITVYFPTNIYTLNNSDKNQLNTFFALYKDSLDNYNVSVFGYTDKYGTKKYNDWLASMRAKTVAKYIEDKFNIIPVEVEGYGKAFYASYSNDFLNRRVEVDFKK